MNLLQYAELAPNVPTEHVVHAETPANEYSPVAHVVHDPEEDTENVPMDFVCSFVLEGGGKGRGGGEETEVNEF